MKLLTKLLLSYLLLIILPLTLLSFFIYNFYSDSARDNAMFSAERSFNQAYSYLNYRLYNILETSLIFAKNTELLEVFRQENPRPASWEELQIMRNIEHAIDPMLDRSNVSQIRLYFKHAYSFTDNNTVFFTMDKYAQTRWYAHVLGSNTAYNWLPEAYLRNDPVAAADGRLTLAMQILDPTNYANMIGMVRFDFPVENIAKVLRNANSVNDSLTYIVNASGEIVVSSDSRFGAAQLPDIGFTTAAAVSGDAWQMFNIAGEDYHIGCRELDADGWYMVTCVPTGALENESRAVMLNVIRTLSVILVVTLLVAFLFSRSITKRLSALSKRMRNVHGGELEVLEDAGATDEIGILISEYNYMTTQIKYLINEQKHTDHELRSAELRALQAQINPHFLYNTLDMINWFAQKDNKRNIIETVNALASFYKCSLRKGREIISIEEELEHVSWYFSIQNMRFSQQLCLKINVSEDAMKCSILKIVLQPIVENSIFHGILGKESKTGTILLTGGVEDDTVLLSVEDDGVGMDETARAALFSDSPYSARGVSGYGIRNIKNRLELYYGDKCEFTVSGIPSGGTVVKIRFPAVVNTK